MHGNYKEKLSAALTSVALQTCVICTACAGHASLLAQEAGQRVTADTAVTTGLFETQDLVLGAMVVGTLIAIPPLDGVDQSVRLSVAGALDDRDVVARSLGRSLGSLPVAVGLTGGTFIVAGMTGHTSLRKAGLHGLEALLLAEAITQIVKFATGRPRPSITSDSDEFYPLRLSADYHSFPSGHTSKVFAIAAAFSSGLKDEAPWVPYVAYPLATWTATTRVLDRRHWVTDVVAGAALGILASRVVGRLNHRGRSGGTAWYVLPGADGSISVMVSAPAP
ncbi:MAG: phosphatase PAP2 family protein [Gemmatimonadetes bacterium]|nr:phosphatase PAP2 family protein [Gemmatimonadota bacterium]NIO32885.1 phosphatase PAP2 family protein [Gemmatimonadota bacterium]